MWAPRCVLTKVGGHGDLHGVSLHSRRGERGEGGSGRGGRHALEDGGDQCLASGGIDQTLPVTWACPPCLVGASSGGVRKPGVDLKWK